MPQAEAVEEFYVEQASMRENFEPARQGRELLIESERRALAGRVRCDPNACTRSSSTPTRW
ncbi:hypothetical protein [Inhella sp.]|uniref:hypothetical protein n=1 Tax=Inhella sp. TaxID=1921806 RepID=UPI0035B02553